MEMTERALESCDRRTFIGALTTSAAALVVPAFAVPRDEVRALCFHWGLNMWGESLPPGMKTITNGRLCNDRVRFKDKLWAELVDRMVAEKMNLVVIDLGEFPVYPSHPELAVKGSRSPEWVNREVNRLKGFGLEPIPKLNFSAGHDAWLGEYSRMLTTRKYYEVCRDIIRDVAEMFDHPRFLHLGYDEERAIHQRGFICVREDELWWHDFNWFVAETEKAGMRPWIWSDYGWFHDDFPSKCPKIVLQSNWYYDEWLEGFDIEACSKNGRSRKILKLYRELDRHGFDQIPCGSNWCSRMRRERKTDNDACMSRLVRFCRENISPDHLKGFLMTPWENCFDEKTGRTQNLNGIRQLAEALS